VIFAIIVINSALDKKHRMRERIKVGLERLLGYTILIITTAGVIPMIQIYTGALVCTSNSKTSELIFEPSYQCFQGIHLLFILLFAF
jgi:ATP/ADP translocase